MPGIRCTEPGQSRRRHRHAAGCHGFACGAPVPSPEWRSVASPISPAVSSPAGTACSRRSARARAVASTWPTTCGCGDASRSRCCTRALADDAGFLRRFRAEAQVAASLHHPNMMAVYDWGEDDVPFMVLELLQRREPARACSTPAPGCSPSQATHVGRQVTRGAGVRARARGRAPRHQAGEPPVRRARHRARRRLRAGARARRGELDRAGRRGRGHRALRGTRAGDRARRSTDAPTSTRWPSCSSEAVTGTVPAVADTAIGTLAARTHTPLVAPLELGRLGPVVERAGRPDPAERYPDAATMGAALADAARCVAAAAAAVARRARRGDRRSPTRRRSGVSDEAVRPGRARRRRVPADPIRRGREAAAPGSVPDRADRRRHRRAARAGRRGCRDRIHRRWQHGRRAVGRGSHVRRGDEAARSGRPRDHDRHARGRRPGRHRDRAAPRRRALRGRRHRRSSWSSRVARRR